MKKLPTPPDQERLARIIENTRWTPIRFAHVNNHEAYWWMRCKCGVEKLVMYDNYKTGKSLSCGCYRNALVAFASLRGGNRLAVGESARNQLMLIYRRGAAKRGLCFELTRERFLLLTSSNCHYCDSPPSAVLDRSKYVGKGNGGYIYNGIDRLDCMSGYTVGNCVPCCRPCNYAKGKLSYEDFIAWLDRLVDFRSSIKKESVAS